MPGVRRGGAEAEAAYDGQDDHLVLSAQARAGEGLPQAVPSSILAGGEQMPRCRSGGSGHGSLRGPRSGTGVPFRS